MGGYPATPAPADFATVAVTMSHAQIEAHYNTTNWKARQWIAGQSQEWRGVWAEHAKARKVVAAAANMALGRVATAYEPRRSERLRIVPEGLYDDLMAMGTAEAGKKNGCSEEVIRRWFATLMPQQKCEIEAARNARRGEKMAKIAEARRALQPPKRDPAPKPPANKKPSRKPSGRGFAKPLSAPAIPGGHLAMAMQHLQRRYRPVCRGEIIGPEWAGLVAIAGAFVPPWVVIDVARQEGLDLDVWKRVAA